MSVRLLWSEVSTVFEGFEEVSLSPFLLCQLITSVRRDAKSGMFSRPSFSQKQDVEWWQCWIHVLCLLQGHQQHWGCSLNAPWSGASSGAVKRSHLFFQSSAPYQIIQETFCICAGSNLWEESYQARHSGWWSASLVSVIWYSFTGQIQPRQNTLSCCFTWFGCFRFPVGGRQKMSFVKVSTGSCSTTAPSRFAPMSGLVKASWRACTSKGLSFLQSLFHHQPQHHAQHQTVTCIGILLIACLLPACS